MCNYLSMETKVLYKKVIHEVEHSFSYSSNVQFTMPLHCHNEYELIFITKGHGLEFIGDSVKEYIAGDLVLIGANVPHLHLCDSVTNKSIKEKSLCEILQFPYGIFPECIKDIQEYSSINYVLNNSLYGIKFTSRSLIEKVLKIMRTINKQQGINRIISLLNILDLLGKSKEISLISSLKYTHPIDCQIINEPISKIYSYINSNFRKIITLIEIANYVKMTPASICRYFKNKTNKTIFEYLNEIRIEHACKLLMYSNLTISQIAYDAGFNNLSHFNKQFKAITKQTPTMYRENISSKIV